MEVRKDLCFIVPTLNRILPLNRLLKSIYSQSVLPSVVIVIDGSFKDQEALLEKNENVKIIYQRCLPPSLTRQRNLGVSLIPAGYNLAGFLDDDLFLNESCIKNMVAFFDRDFDKKYAGASFNIVNQSENRSFIKKLYNSLFLMIPKNTGGISVSGSITLNNNQANEIINTQWLCGGATVWRKMVFNQFKFDEWYKGYALFEDIDFSYQVSRNYSLAIVSNSHVLHLHEYNLMTKKNALKYGDVEVVDKLYFVSKNKNEFNMYACYWSCIGLFIRNFLFSIFKFESSTAFRAYANLRAIIRCAFLGISRGSYYL